MTLLILLFVVCFQVYPTQQVRVVKVMFVFPVPTVPCPLTESMDTSVRPVPTVLHSPT